jgi:protoporphyrinogen oxidase
MKIFLLLFLFSLQNAFALAPDLKAILEKDYKVKAEDLVDGKYPLLINGTDGSLPRADYDSVVKGENFDTIVVGAGPAGLTATLHQATNGKKVLLLEREKTIGGLAAGGNRNNLRFGRGAAYFPEADGKYLPEVYKFVGLGGYEKKYAIPEPIDSYLWNGELHLGMWEDAETMKNLSTSFELLRYTLRKLEKEKLIPVQPMEEHAGTKELDKVNTRDWLKSLPDYVKKQSETDPDAKALYERFANDSRVSKSDPMIDVIHFLDLYCRSSLGGETNEVSGAAFVNFYISEIGPRYAGTTGSGAIVDIIAKKLAGKKNARILTDSPVVKIVNRDKGVDVYYVNNGKTIVASARNAIFAAQLKFAPKIIENFSALAPKHAKIINEIPYRNYIVTNVHVKGHPWKKTYDLWLRNDGEYTTKKITDVIEGRWVEFHGDKAARKDQRGVLSIYYPLPKDYAGAPMTKEMVVNLATDAIDQLQAVLKNQVDGGKLDILFADVNRWPDSIHVAKPGHFANAAVIEQPVGNIFLANNNIGTPAAEEAMYRGYRNSQEVIEAQKKK